MNLYAPESYLSATKEARNATCNGCGTEGFGGWIVPDTIWGLSISECCNIHDWMYEHGVSIEDKREADRVFLNNMMRLIEEGCAWLRFLRRIRARTYYRSVRDFGGSAYWDNKV